MSTSLSTAAIQIAHHFRLGEVAMGSACLAELVDGLQKIVAQGLSADVGQGLLQMLEMIVDAQSRGDYLLVADLLEYEAVKILGVETQQPD